MDLQKAMMVSASGLHSQSVRMRIISENLANQDSVSVAPGVDPYRRKVATFQSELDDVMGVELVSPGKTAFDQSDFSRKYDPGHPAADEDGYIFKSNVNGLVEMMDMRQAQRSYQSNLNALEGSRKMATMTLDLLR
ncbi:flagellar basal-body rod protein FlgC [Kordiimonas sediminis]|uniref:Flagellar basal-body rod protein FlgC n=1 Tax=Kordiimonas sediminis TaxID=1735581 RepID=A0A919AWM7_9PROT|nr:flagellar basal body rod protein FlgC [Kordiimonas sediminis]GHF27062.1 flagellar basal-body rod protein FlgC [Kordiimonas sediminis]